MKPTINRQLDTHMVSSTGSPGQQASTCTEELTL